MNFTKEQLTKAKAAKSAEELLSLAKENNVELTEEEAAKHFAELHKEGLLADDELDNVSGGGCGDDLKQLVYGDYTPMHCKSCGWTTAWDGKHDSILPYKGPCPECGAEYIYAAGAYVPPLF